MDAMRALASQGGCTVDGTTAAASNPVQNFVNAALPMGGMGGKMGPRPMGAVHGARPGGQMSALDRGMQEGLMGRPAPGTGAVARPVGPNSFVQEFERLNMQHGPRGPIQHGPRGPMMASNSGDRWAQEFAVRGGAPNPHMQAAYNEAFMHARPPPPMPMANQWANEMHARHAQQMMNNAWQQNTSERWANEMVAAPAQQQPKGEASDMQATREASAEMLRAMANDPKMRNSQFFDFMSKVSNGEVTFEDNKVLPTGKTSSGNMNAVLEGAWNDQVKLAPPPVGAQANMESAWKEVPDMPVQEMSQPPPSGPEEILAQAWKDSMAGKEVDFDQVWSRALEQSGTNLEEIWKEQQNPLNMAWGETQTASPADTAYNFEESNKYSEHNNAFEEGLVLFKNGQLKEAILAFEAAVQKDNSHAEAWRMLGVSHQENDEDRKAIVCLERAVEQDAYHLEALLGLGVSYVNELDQERALKNLKAWVQHNPKFQGVEVVADMYSDGSLMDEVMQLMIKASHAAPKDPDVQEVLGVLYNVSRDYDSAAKAFRLALDQRPDDYGLWNKLGATLANGSRSDDALPAYYRALELKPKYARGWLNLGISHSNLGKYGDAARCYLKALDLNPEANHIWSYLRICFTCMERFDLVEKVDAHALDSFRAEFKF